MNALIRLLEESVNVLTRLQTTLILESFLLFLALFCIFALVIIFLVHRVQQTGRNVDPIPIIPRGEGSGGKS